MHGSLEGLGALWQNGSTVAEWPSAKGTGTLRIETAPAKMKRTFRLLGWVLVWLLALACSLWAFGALLHDFPVLNGVVAWTFLLALPLAVAFTPGRWRKPGVPLSGFAVVLVWWLTLAPRNDRAWQPDVARTAWAEINGDEVILHNVRSCVYRTESDYSPQWETRSVRLSRITGIDLAICYWGSPWMAHPIASFQFSDVPPVCFSIETRKETGESYSAIGGIYRQFELIYIVAEERDVIGLRTGFRQGEDVYLYRTAATPEQARERFLEYLQSLNRLRERPRWYNALTTNCTTAIREQHPAAERVPWDWRLLLNGKADEFMFEMRTIVTDGFAFPELKERARIAGEARSGGDSAAFSQQIRRNRPGFR